MKPPTTLPLLLATSVCLIAHAAPPVFTFTTGMKRRAGWACAMYRPELLPDISFNVQASSTGELQISGLCTEFGIAQVVFEQNLVQWNIDPGWKSPWDICGRCSDGEMYYWQPTQPRISCNAPFYAEFHDPTYTWNMDDLAFTGEPKTSWGFAEYWGTQDRQESMSRAGEMRFTFCRDDFDASGSIDGGDIGMMMLWWGASNSNGMLFFCSHMDLDEDGEIGASDIAF